mgnify:CR=1 FL=1
MNFLTNFNLAGMEFHYALGLVGLFLGTILLITAAYYGLVEPIRRRRLINQRLRGNKQEQAVRAQVFKAFQETKESVILNLAERYFGWGKVDNLQRQLLQGDIYLAPNTFICIAILLSGLGFFIGWLVGSWAWSLGLSLLSLLSWGCFLSCFCGGSGGARLPRSSVICPTPWSCWPDLCGPATPCRAP